MKFCLVGLAATALLAGCARHYPDAPLRADTNLAKQCAAIRGNVPFRDRGTAADPTTRPESLCRSVPAAAYALPAGPGPNSRLFPGRAVYDAAFDY